MSRRLAAAAVVRERSSFLFIGSILCAGSILGFSSTSATAAPGSAGASEIAIGGRVLGPGGAPLADAEVLLLASPDPLQAATLADTGAAAKPIVRVVTDPQGRYRLAAPTAGLYRLRVQASGFVPLEASLEPLIEPIDLSDAEMASDIGLTVKVTDRDGRPVAGARVRLASGPPSGGPRFSSALRWEPAVQTAITDPNGVARLLRADQTSSVLTASAPGLLTLERRNLRGTAAVLKLEPGTTRAISVVSADRSPAAGVLVLDADRSHALGFTDAQGRFTVAVPAAGALSLRLIAPDGRRLEGRVTAAPAEPGGAGGKPATLRSPTGGVAESGARPASHDSRTVTAAPVPSDSGTTALSGPAAPRIFTLPARFALKGRVIDGRDRKPLAGAVVWADDEIWGAAVTDAAGQYTLRGAGGQSLGIVAGAPGYLKPAPSPYTVTSEGRLGPTLALKPAAAIEGSVVDEGGQPVAGAEATLAVKQPEGRMIVHFGAEAPPPRAVTSSRGTFRISPVDPKDNYDLKVKASGFAPASREVVGLEPRRTLGGVRVEMSRGQTVSGVAVDGEGHPIRDASASLRPARKRQMPGMVMLGEPDAAPSAFKASTDAQGRFRISGTATGTFDLELRKPGFAKKTVQGVEVPKQAEPVDLGSIALEAGARIQGMVAAADGMPIEGVEVRVVPGGAGPGMMFGGGRAQQPPDTVSGPEGRFTLDDLSPGDPVNLTFSRTGYVQARESGIAVPRTDPLMVTMQAASKVSGRVLGPDKKPLPGAQVSLTRSQSGGIGGSMFKMIMRDGATADDQGFFVFDNVRPGQVSLSAVAPGWQEAKMDGVDVPEGKDVEGLELPLKQGAVITGRIVAPDGRPVIGARIAPVSDDPEPLRIGGITSDGDGNYKLEGLAPGRVSIEATHDDYVRTVKEIEARAGANKLDLQFEGGQDVSGLVTDANGGPIAGASVQLTAVGRDWGGPDTKSAADGTFKLSGVGDGDYHLGASREGYAASGDDLSVHVAGKPVAGLKVALGAGGRIIGRVSGLDADKMPQVELRAFNTEREGSATAAPDREGKFKMEHLTAGRWTVIAALPNTGQQARGQTVLDPGDNEAAIDLQFGVGLTLSGRALIGEAPVKGAVLFARGTDVNHSAWGRTGNDGEFRIEGLEPGTYGVELTQWETGLSYDETVEVKSSRDVTLKVPTAKIVGQVVDGADRRPLAGVTVSLGRPGGADPSRTLAPRGATSDLNGRFELPNVTDGSWTLTANRTGYAAGSADVTVEGGHDPDTVKLALDPTEGITLEVRLPSGRVPDTIDVAVLDAGGRALTAGSYATGENGRVRLSSVPPGTWDLIVSAGGSGAMNLRVSVPGQTLAIALPPACQMKVTVPALAGSTTAATAKIVGPDGRAFRSLGWMSDTTSQWRLSGGRVELDTLPPGSWTVQVASSDGRTWTGSSSTEPGKPAEVVLQ